MMNDSDTPISQFDTSHHGNDGTVTPQKPEKGRVKRVRNAWLVHEDGALAQHMQNEEFSRKYQFNKDERRTAGTDVPLAKFVQSEEEQTLQRERFELLERQREITERDKKIAEEVHQLEQEKTQFEKKNIETEDMVIASQLQQEELIKVEHGRLRSEIRDQEYARLLYEKERRSYENRLRKKELSRERRRLEGEQQVETERLMAGYKPESGVNQRMAALTLDENDEMEPSRLLRTDGRVEDLGDFSDFYIKPDQKMEPHEKRQLQELQDEELARLLQDQERKRGAKVDKTRLKTLEERDAELAHIMQEQERLKTKHRHHRQAGRHHSHQDEHTEPHLNTHTSHDHGGRHRSDPGDLPHKYQGETSPIPHYEQQNSYNDSVNGTSHERGEIHSDRMPLYRGPAQSPYSQRPLPRTPLEASNDHNHDPDTVTVVPVRTEDMNPPGSTPPPGYRPPPAYPNPRRMEQTTHSKATIPQTRNKHSNNSSPPDNNVIAAIDPTFRGPPSHRITPPEQRLDHSTLPVRQTPGSTLGTRTHQPGIEEPGYCDLDDLGPIQGQKRSTLQQDGQAKRNSCKQQ